MFAVDRRKILVVWHQWTESKHAALSALFEWSSQPRCRQYALIELASLGDAGTPVQCLWGRYRHLDRPRLDETERRFDRDESDRSKSQECSNSRSERGMEYRSNMFDDRNRIEHVDIEIDRRATTSRASENNRHCWKSRLILDSQCSFVWTSCNSSSLIQIDNSLISDPSVSILVLVWSHRLAWSSSEESVRYNLSIPIGWRRNRQWWWSASSNHRWNEQQHSTCAFRFEAPQWQR